jgi:hypothetical protein
LHALRQWRRQQMAGVYSFGQKKISIQCITIRELIAA